ncbi:hypothetical protein C8R44DRAFT_787607 [Mycena epipterygia]|nr:hypothetical protein C8R44DRAFT_787607 [Mycena epipterygia]
MVSIWEELENFSDFEVSLPACAQLEIASAPTRSQGIGWPRAAHISALAPPKRTSEEARPATSAG